MAEKPKYNNYPLKEIEEACLQHIKNGATIYQKYTCSGCGTRLMMQTPNIIFTEGACDRCDAITDIAKDGCNYLLTTETTLGALSATLKGMKGDEE